LPEVTALNTVELAADLTIARLSNAHTRASADEVNAFLKSMHKAVGEFVDGADESVEAAAPEPTYVPAVSVRKSLASPDQIISLIDGKPYEALKRHLLRHGLTPDEYRDRYGLKPDYPMVAPGYSEARRATAKRLGLGRKPAQTAAPASESAVEKPAPRPRGRKTAAEARDAAKKHLGG
jgi:predicted transcriptional regulator